MDADAAHLAGLGGGGAGRTQENPPSGRKMVLVVTIVRTGGFAGLRRRWGVELDDPREAETWRPLIEACPWDDEPVILPEPDRFVYQIDTVTRDARMRATVRRATVPERHLTGPWRELLDRVREAEQPGRARPRRGS